VREGGLPILHIAEAACAQFAARSIRADTVGLIATQGTLAAGFFQERLGALGYRCIANTAADQESLVLPAIERVKRNELPQAHALIVRAAQNLHAQGAQAIILACTEIPLALEYEATDIAGVCVDATRALAQACVAWSRAQRTPRLDK